jgi:regulatory protein
MWKRRPAREESSVDAPASGRVSAIKQQEHDPNRVSVFLDGVFAFGLGAAETISEGLHVGDELTAARVAELRALDEVGRATQAALRFVSYRARSVREVRDRLRQRGFAPKAIEAAVEKLEGWRYLDDEDFSRLWVEHRERLRPRGRRLLELELRAKGVDRETVRETLDAADLDESAAALELARAKLRAYAGEERPVVRRRLAGFLARRGYDAATVRSVLDRALGEDPSDSDAESQPDA